MLVLVICLCYVFAIFLHSPLPCIVYYTSVEEVLAAFIRIRDLEFTWNNTHYYRVPTLRSRRRSDDYGRPTVEKQEGVEGEEA